MYTKGGIVGVDGSTIIHMGTGSKGPERAKGQDGAAYGQARVIRCIQYSLEIAEGVCMPLAPSILDL